MVARCAIPLQLEELAPGQTELGSANHGLRRFLSGRVDDLDPSHLRMQHVCVAKVFTAHASEVAGFGSRLVAAHRELDTRVIHLGDLGEALVLFLWRRFPRIRERKSHFHWNARGGLSRDLLGSSWTACSAVAARHQSVRNSRSSLSHAE
jgi:hypothetical protein